MTCKGHFGTQFVDELLKSQFNYSIAILDQKLHVEFELSFDTTKVIRVNESETFLNLNDVNQVH